MEFTNDIRFNRKPKNNKLVRVTYSGNLYKSGSEDVYIVYGFGENWANTTEQKMTKTSYGFVYNVLMENFNTFNFCFRNGQNEWDNNNSFDYIAPIELSNTDGVIETVTEEESKQIVAKYLDSILNAANIDLEAEQDAKNIEVNNDSELLDALVQELFEEYSKPNTANADLFTDAELDAYYNNIENQEADSSLESYKQVTELFDNLIQNIEGNEVKAETIETVETTNTVNSQNVEKAEVTVEENEVDIGIELSQIFEQIFGGATPVVESEETYVPTASEVSFADENNIFDFENKEFDFSDLEANISSIETVAEEAPQISHAVSNESSDSFVTTRNCSDSFYDDQDNSVHQISYNFQNIVESTVNELNTETSATSIATEKEEFQKQSEEFDKAVSEYAEYFDNLIEEIISGPVTNLASTVSNEEVFENEHTDIAVAQTEENTQLATTSEEEGVKEELSLLDYENQGMFANIARQVKLAFKTLFEKLPKLFGRENDTNE